MVAQFDVSSRIAEGRPAVENVQHYVWACQQLGYAHPDLTVRAAQLHDWYASEDGMDLSALHHDWESLREAARAAHEALAIQDRQLALLPVAWQGAGAWAAQDRLRRHGEASAAAAASVRNAMDALETLQESLWRTVDAKVDAVIAIEGRTEGCRGDWLAAAATVTTGVGERSVAAERVDREVKPFVDSSVRSDWLTTMENAMTAVAGAYRRAAADILIDSQPVFGAPGEVDSMGSLGPMPPAAPPAAPAVTTPSALSPPASGAAEMPPAHAGSVMPPLTGMGGGSPGFGGGLPGLAGLGRPFADMVAGLLGGPGSPDSPEALAVDPAVDPDLEPAADTPDEDTDTDEGEIDDQEVDQEEEEEEDETAQDPAVEDVVEEPAEVPGDSVPAPPPAPPPAEPLPPPDQVPAESVAAERTPCAIAADEVPQVGGPP